MPALPERIRTAALRSQQELADETTPLLRNAWYVAALAAEVNRTPLARRLLEAGVRFVQVIAMGWDSHDYIDKAHGARIRAIDQGIGGLLRDLKQRGMLEDTLVVWAGEFGRSPDNGIRREGAVWGRDHNATAMAVWLAGGGVKAGHIVGATDETGYVQPSYKRLREVRGKRSI